MRRRTRKRPDVLSGEQVEALLGAVSGQSATAKRTRALLEVMAFEGLRLAETLGLRPGDVSLRDKGLYVRKGKGGEPRKVPLFSRVLRALDEWGRVRPKHSRYLFCTLSGGSKNNRPTKPGKPLPRTYVQNLLARLGDKAGIDLGERPNGQRKRVHPHLLRHTAATMLLDQGWSTLQIAKFLGHADVRNTQIYAEATDQQLDQKAAETDRVLEREGQDAEADSLAEKLKDLPKETLIELLGDALKKAGESGAKSASP